MKLKNRFISALLIFYIVLALPVSSEQDDDINVNVKPIDGELVLPDDYNKTAGEKCLTVCGKWGEDCLINPRTGSRKCRRICKSFTEECFRK